MRQVEWKAVPEDLRAFHIWCFTCKQKTSKRKLKSEHLDHEVDYIRSDGERYSFLPDSVIPKAKIEQPFV